MSRFLNVAYVLQHEPVPQPDILVKSGDYFRDNAGVVYIAYRHYDTNKWVLIDLETGCGHGGNTTKDNPMLSEVSGLSIRVTKIVP